MDDNKPFARVETTFRGKGAESERMVRVLLRDDSSLLWPGRPVGEIVSALNAAHDSSIARLRAALDAAKAAAKDATDCFVSLLDDAKRLRSDLAAARAALKSAVDPVRSWFDGDGNINPPPTDADIARMAVEELQRDRDELLSMQAKLRVWRDPVADAIRSTITEISEGNWCAGWVCGIEYRIWRDVTTGTRDECSDKEAANLGVLSKIVDGWVHWSSGVGGPTFIALDEWIARYEVWLSVDNARRAAEAKGV